jgi:predicted component of type VI protein secretion system
VERLLLFCGLLDIAAAPPLLLGVRAAAWYMACWGTFTALLRVLAYGPGALAEMVVRLPHGLLPLLFVGASSAPTPVTEPSP